MITAFHSVILLDFLYTSTDWQFYCIDLSLIVHMCRVSSKVITHSLHLNLQWTSIEIDTVVNTCFKEYIFKKCWKFIRKLHWQSSFPKRTTPSISLRMSSISEQLFFTSPLDECFSLNTKSLIESFIPR